MKGSMNTKDAELEREGVGARRQQDRLPIYLTVDEVAEILRTTRVAIYTMVQRQQLPGVRRIGRRVLVRRASLLCWVEERAGGSCVDPPPRPPRSPAGAGLTNAAS